MLRGNVVAGRLALNNIRALSITNTNLVQYIYSITFKTGDVFGAGTNSNVFIRMVGQHGSTEEIQIPTRPRDLERAMTNTYRVTSDYVGPLSKLIVRHDNSGIASAWYLEKVSVRDGKGEMFHFRCNDWLAKSMSDDPVRLLKPSNGIQDETLARSAKTEDTSTDGQINEIPPGNLNDVMNKIVVNSELNQVEEREVTPIIESIPSVDSSSPQQHQHQQSLRHADSLSPAVRYLLQTYGINLLRVKPSGPHARVLKGDVLNYMHQENITNPVPILVETTAPKKPIEELQVHHQDITVDQPLHMNKEIIGVTSSVPHIYMNSVCCLDKFKTSLKQLETIYDNSSLENLYLTRIFTHSLLATLGVHEMKIAVCHSDKQVVISDNVGDDMQKLIKQYQNNDRSVNDTPPAYVLNVQLSTGGVTQLSTVLTSDETLCLNISGERIGINKDGKISSYCSIALTSNGQKINEIQSATILEKLKHFIENPDQIGI